MARCETKAVASIPLHNLTVAAAPRKAFCSLVEKWRSLGIHVETGEFGADMQVSLINDGPVTILLGSRRIF